jgi:CopG family nickel-responsive transcriptional regulator
MVPVVAISMPDSDLEQLEKMQEIGSYSNRSEVMRHALQALVKERTKLEEVSGTITAVITIVYHEDGKDGFCNSIQHSHARMITAMMHSHSQEGECLEVFVLRGDASNLRDFVDGFKSGRQVNRIYVNVVGE